MPKLCHAPRRRVSISDVIAQATLACAMAVLAAAPLFAQRRTEGSVAFINANVVDVETGTVADGRTIVLRDGKIAAVGAAGAVRVPPGAQVINVGGRYVIPGLWDMHVHRQAGAWFDSLASTPEARAAALTYFRALFIASGVTGIREMGGDLALLRAGDEDALRSGAPTPRVLLTGGRIGDRAAVAGAPDPVRSEADVWSAVSALRTAGATHAKLAPRLPPTLVRAALDACRQQRISCTSHAPSGVPIREAATRGLHSLEHVFGLPEQTSSLNESQLTAWSVERDAPSFVRRVFYKLRLRRPPPDVVDTAIASHDAAKAASLFQALARAGTWITPTLTLHDGLTRVGARDTLARDARYLIEPLPASFSEDRRAPASRAHAARLEALHQRLVREMRDAGVGILAGTDVPVNAAPGLSLHGELWLLQRAGLTPAQALRAATLEPARYAGATDTLGTVRTGRAADLVVLRDNPLADIRNTRRIEMVVSRGRVLRRPQLDSLLAEGARALALVRAALGREPESPTEPGTDQSNVIGSRSTITRTAERSAGKRRAK